MVELNQKVDINLIKMKEDYDHRVKSIKVMD